MRFLVLGIIVLFALLAGYASLQLVEKAAPPPQSAPAVNQMNVVDVVVAKDAIPIGTIITEDMVDKQPWPQHLVLDGFVVAHDRDTNVVGMVARSDFQAREPLILSKLGNPNDGNFLAAALGQGMRAITVSVDAISGVAGYVFPGDHVDVLVTHATATVGGGPDASEVLLQNIKVLATELRQGNKTNAAPTTITLEVTPEEAQKIRLGERRGTLAIALRSLKDSEQASAPTPTVVGDLSQMRAAKAGEINEVVIVRGTSASSQIIGGISGLLGLGGSGSASGAGGSGGTP